jgi:hypothetical protein
MIPKSLFLCSLAGNPMEESLKSASSRLAAHWPESFMRVGGIYFYTVSSLGTSPGAEKAPSYPFVS